MSKLAVGMIVYGVLVSMYCLANAIYMIAYVKNGISIKIE